MLRGEMAPAYPQTSEAPTVLVTEPREGVRNAATYTGRVWWWATSIVRLDNAAQQLMV